MQCAITGCNGGEVRTLLCPFWRSPARATGVAGVRPKESQLARSEDGGVCYFNEVAWPRLTIRPEAASTSLITRKVRRTLINDGTSGNKRAKRSLATSRITRTRSLEIERMHTETSPKGRQSISGRQ